MGQFAEDINVFGETSDPAGEANEWMHLDVQKSSLGINQIVVMSYKWKKKKCLYGRIDDTLKFS